jgi:hypothetical protein
MDERTVLLELRQMIDERDTKLKAAHSELEALLRKRISLLEDRVSELEHPPNEDSKK